MKAIILAAGRGSRMQQGTADKPKCLMQLCGHTLLEYGILSLKKAGFFEDDIGIVTGYRNDMIQIPHIHYFHNNNWENTNMFVSLTQAEEWLTSETCIVCYSDIVFHETAVKKLMATDSNCAITYYTGFWELWNKRFNDPFEDLETFKKRGSVLTEIGQKPSNRADVQGQYMGLLRFTPHSWQDVTRVIQTPLPKPIDKLDMTTLLQAMLNLGVSIEAISTDDLWLECDNMQDVELYEKEYLPLLEAFWQ